jgi:DcuC family C4-dicarboxylate transporter
MALPHSVSLAVAALIVAAGIFFVVRRVDVRLVLFLSGVLLAALAGNPFAALDKFADTMVNPAFVVPICCSMGFAHVVKATGCDGHLVRLLVLPLRRLGPLVAPIAIFVPFVVNTAITSQSSTAATVGPVLLPLLLATGLTPVQAGVALLIGSSVGGELLNAGAPEIAAIAKAANVETLTVIGRMLPVALTVAVVAALLYWRGLRYSDPPLDSPAERQGEDSAHSHEFARLTKTDPAAKEEPISLLKAAIPLVPIVLLILDSRLHLILGPGHHLFPRPADPEAWKEWMPIGYAMLIGTGVAMTTAPKRLSANTVAFFQGQGFAYAYIISLIVAALTFVEGLKQSGLMKVLLDTVAGNGTLAVPAAVLLPGSMALLTGSGIAPSVTFIETFLPHAQSWHVDPMGLGIVAAQAAAIGRTLSPAAAVVMVCGMLAGVPPLALLRRAALPLATGWLVVLAFGFWLT